MLKICAFLPILALCAAPVSAQTEPPAAPSTRPFATLGRDTSMMIGGLAQFRYAYADAVSHSTNTSSFAIRTARLMFTGDLPGRFRYSVTLDFARTASTYTITENSALYDWTLLYAHSGALNLTMGQFTVPVGAELLTPTAQIDFGARYYAQDRILNPSANHDTGVMASGKVFGERLQYYAGAFNGKGPNHTDNDNEKFLYAGRLAWTAFKGPLFGEDATLILGGSGMGESTRCDPSALKAYDIGKVNTSFHGAYGRYVYGGDAALRVGPAALKSEYIAALLDGRRSDPEIRAYGWHVTAAWRLPGGKIELLARRQGYDPNTAHRTVSDIKWTTLGVNWFVNGAARVLANYTFKREAAAATPNDEFITQLQLSF